MLFNEVISCNDPYIEKYITIFKKRNLFKEQIITFTD